MIINYIIDILKTEDNIYINDLGLFEKRLVPAQMKGGELTPPRYKIFFNAHGDGNGFAFILKYSEREQKRLTDADAEIRQWVEELKRGIANNKSVTVGNFGSFTLNAKGDIIFDSAFIKELNLEFEGMGPVSVSPLSETAQDDLLTQPGENLAPAKDNPDIRESHELTPRTEPQENENSCDASGEAAPASTERVETYETVESEIPERDNMESRPAMLTEEEISLSSQEDTSPKEEERAIETAFEEPEVKENTPLTEVTEEDETIEDHSERKDEIAEDSEEKKEKKRGWIVVVIIGLILILGAAGYLGYRYRTPLELTFKEYRHKWFGNKKNGASLFPNEKPVEIHLFTDSPYTTIPEKKTDSVLIPYVKGYVPAETKEEVLPTENQPAVSSVPAPVAAESVISGSNRETSRSGSRDFPRNTYSTGKYYVIAGSFTNEKDAAKHIRDTKLESYNPTLLYQEGNNRIRVCIGVFDSETEAENFAAGFHKNYWVLK